MNHNAMLKDKPKQTVTPDVLPAHTWQRSTPEQQGMDSGKLVEMIEFYQDKHTKSDKIMIDSITIIRNDHIVADIYLNPLFPKDHLHIINSCTKSVMSILIGIAIDKGYIDDVHLRVIDIFPDKHPKQIDEKLSQLTLEDLLTMQTGLHSQDSYVYEWRGLFKMMATDDWVKHIFRLPMVTEPGQHFDYSNMSSFLLSAVLTKMTGMDSLSFARQFLFDPLDIQDVRWEKSPQGIYVGFARMWLKPHDMAKLGKLYLQKGKWGERQIVSAEWVLQSTRIHSHPKKYRKIYRDDGRVDRIASGGIWIFTNLLRPFSDGYGYQWWLGKNGMYTAIGVGGQYIMVVPKSNLIVIATSKLGGADSFLPATLLKKYILPAILSDEAIADNSIPQNKLKALSGPPKLAIDPKPIPPLPTTAHHVSGRVYALESNPWQYDNFQLIFDPQQDYAVFRYTAKDKHIQFDVGMDHVFRLTESENDSYAAKGYWIAPDTFVIEYEMIGYSAKGKWTLQFAQDNIAVDEVGVTGAYTYKGHVKEI